MKKKEKISFVSMKTDELVKVISGTQLKLAQLVRDRYSKQSKNVREGKALRQKIAVAKTILHIKELQHE